MPLVCPALPKSSAMELGAMPRAAAYVVMLRVAGRVVLAKLPSVLNVTLPEETRPFVLVTSAAGRT
jgi:hypothetical protein